MLVAISRRPHTRMLLDSRIQVLLVDYRQETSLHDSCIQVLISEREALFHRRHRPPSLIEGTARPPNISPHDPMTHRVSDKCLRAIQKALEIGYHTSSVAEGATLEELAPDVDSASSPSVFLVRLHRAGQADGNPYTEDGTTHQQGILDHVNSGLKGPSAV